MDHEPELRRLLDVQGSSIFTANYTRINSSARLFVKQFRNGWDIFLQSPKQTQDLKCKRWKEISLSFTKDKRSQAGSRNSNKVSEAKTRDKGRFTCFRQTSFLQDLWVAQEWNKTKTDQVLQVTPGKQSSPNDVRNSTLNNENWPLF